MRRDKSKSITISLKISIPCDGSQTIEFQQPEVEIPNERHAAREESPKDWLTVDRPANGEMWPVKTAGGSGGSGIICAFGNATAVLPSPDKVKGHCFVGYVAPDPPMGADEISIEDNFWKLEEVPGAVSGVNNVLKVWYYKNGVVVYTEERSFVGTASDMTYCEMSNGPAHTALNATSRRVYLPVVMVVETQGFSEEVAGFNGERQLHIVPDLDNSRVAVWRSRDAVPESPEVQLTANLDDNSAVLLFKHGVTEVEYRKVGGTWNPANVCEFADVTSSAIQPSASLPAIVPVRPGVAS